MARETFVPTTEGKEESSEHRPETGENRQEDVEIGDAKEIRFQMRVDSGKYHHLEKVANYAAAEGIIASNHRGNITAWAQYCLIIGEEVVKEHECQKLTESQTLSQGQHQNRYHQPHRVRSNLKRPFARRRTVENNR